MSQTIHHRGPDAKGVLETAEVHLASRRLRVIDLEGGDQPIYNEDGTIGVVYNGEIYNFQELRRELEAKGHRFRTRSDTEVIVHLYEEHGTLFPRYLNGMFAFALHDARQQRLLLARDPVGIKPLVYHWTGNTLVFGSEVKSLLPHPKVSPALDADSLHLLLNVRFVPGPRTLFEGISQLPPGHCLIVEGDACKTIRYHDWEFPGTRIISPSEAAEGFIEILEQAVKRQMVADVPLGIYLSGGIDSSSILAGAVRAGLRDNLRTFTLGFGEPTDELEDAAVVADHFGTNHHTTSLSPRPLALYPRIVFHTEVPKVNAPQGYYLSQFARKDVTVALSGMGGDELFLGYDIYRYLWPGRWLIDSPLGTLFARVSPAADSLADSADRLAGPRGENARRALELLACGKDPLRYYLTMRNSWDLGRVSAERIYTDSWQRHISLTTREAFAPYFDRPDLPFIEQVQWAEFRSKIVDDFLANEDRMSMAHSLEVRVPLLDLEMVRFAFSLPLEVKFERQRLKQVMKRALAPLLPPATLRKKKWGFTFNPYEQFKKDLRDLCQRELNQSFIERQGIFRYDFIKNILDHPPSPLLRWHYFMIWQILGLKFWQEIFLEGRSWEEIEERIAT
jgi:asparagine synthase (glutamine-hydrolysing)